MTLRILFLLMFITLISSADQEVRQADGSLNINIEVRVGSDVTKKSYRFPRDFTLQKLITLGIQKQKGLHKDKDPNIPHRFSISRICGRVTLKRNGVIVGKQGIRFSKLRKLKRDLPLENGDVIILEPLCIW